MSTKKRRVSTFIFPTGILIGLILAAAFFMAACEEDALPVVTYTVTVNVQGGATRGNADVRLKDDDEGASSISAVPGAEIELHAVPNTGFVFNRWNPGLTGPTLSPDNNADTATFTMPSANVTVTAIFAVEQAPIISHSFDPAPAFGGVFAINHQSAAYADFTDLVFTNSGAVPITVVSLAGANASAISASVTAAEIALIEGSPIAPNASRPVGIRPNAAQARGDHSATLTLTYREGTNTTTKEYSLELRFSIIRAIGANVSTPTNAIWNQSGITVNAVTIQPPGSSTTQSPEYALSTSAMPPADPNTLNWQSSRTFGNALLNATVNTYYIFARSAANENYAAGTNISVSPAITRP